MKPTLICFSLLALSLMTGCSTLQTKVEADLTSATALATSNGDTQAANCFTALSKALAVQSGAGAFTALESLRLGGSSLASCAVIAPTK